MNIIVDQLKTPLFQSDEVDSSPTLVPGKVGKIQFAKQRGI